MERSNDKIGSRNEGHGFLTTLFNHRGVWIACSTDITTDEINAKM